jgi:hypothetical protein
MMDSYRKGWALRYLREAKAELEAAKKMPFMAPSLVLEAVRKARNAIYYSLGEPAFIEIIIRETAEKMQGQPAADPILKFLVDIESMVQQLSQVEEMDGEQAMKQADGLVNLAQEIVEALTEEKGKN